MNSRRVLKVRSSSRDSDVYEALALDLPGVLAGARTKSDPLLHTNSTTKYNGENEYESRFHRTHRVTCMVCTTDDFGIHFGNCRRSKNGKQAQARTPVDSTILSENRQIHQ
jgi:hypothetical protein